MMALFRVRNPYLSYVVVPWEDHRLGEAVLTKISTGADTADKRLGTTVALRLTPDEGLAVKALAESAGQGASAILREAVRQMLEPQLNYFHFETGGVAGYPAVLVMDVTWAPGVSVPPTGSWTGDQAV